MNQPIQDIKIKLDQKVKEFIDEQRFPVYYFVLNNYLELINTQPLLSNLLNNLKKEFDEKYNSGEKFFNSADEIINLEAIEFKDGKFKSNLWFIYGYFCEVSRGFALFRSVFKKQGEQGIENILREEIIPTFISLKGEDDDLKSMIPALEKKVIDKFLTLLNEIVVSELAMRDYLQNEPEITKTYFDNKNSILHLRGQKIKIARKNDTTNSDFVLNYIFKRGKFENHFFSEMYKQDEPEQSEYSWKKYHRACLAIMDKIKKDADIDDFFNLKSGKTGSVQINKNYL